jgi:hypothetical protein
LRYPTQLYEVGLGLFVMLCLYLVDRMKGQEKRPRGLLISVFFVVYFAGRFLVEFYKEHQTAEPTGFLTMGQYLSIPGFVLGVVGVIATLKNPVPSGWPKEDPPEDGDEDEDGDDDDDEDEDDDEAGAADKRYDPDVDEELMGDVPPAENPNEPTSDTDESQEPEAREDNRAKESNGATENNDEEKKVD